MLKPRLDGWVESVFPFAATVPLELSFQNCISFNAPVSARLKTSGNQIDLVYAILKSDAISCEKFFPMWMGKYDTVRSFPYL